MEYKPEFLYLTTIGWKSGSPREIEIWYVPYRDCYYLCAEHFEETHWVKNIRHNSAVSFWVNGQRYEGQGRPLDSTTDADLIQSVSALFAQKYEWSDGLLVELCPNCSNRDI